MTAQVVEGRINDRWPLWLTPDRQAFHEVRPTWEVERLASMFSELSPGCLVVDVGAECGDFTALYASWGMRVVPIEPAGAYWPAIRAHCEANDAEVPWAFHGFAADRPLVANEPAGAPIAGAERWWPAAADGPIIPDAGFAHLCAASGNVPARPLADLCEGGPPVDALTIDVEGAEYRVLVGATPLLLRDRPLVWVAIHLDAQWMADQYPGEGRDAVERLFEAAEYDVVELATSHEAHLLATPR